MKYLTILFLALSQFFGHSFSHASISDHFDQYLSYYWDGSEDDLYLNLNISQLLEFADTYTTTEDDNEQGGIIVCKPILGKSIFIEGYELQEFKFHVFVENTKNSSRVAYTIIIEGSFEGIDEDSEFVSITAKRTIEGRLVTPAIDLTQEPDFFLNNGSLYEGVFSFKNSFPSSQAE